MSLRLFSNNASATLAAPITSTATALSVTAGSGALFPAPSGGTSFTATLQHIVAGVVTAYEIILVTGRSTDNFTTIVRAQENTTALAWNAGDTIALLPTANGLAQMAQFDDLQRQFGNFATDTGTANAYVVGLTPALTAHVVGMPIRWTALHPNTGGSTFNDGVGAGALVLAPGEPLPAGTIVAGGMYVSTWDGTEFQLTFAPNLALYAPLTALGAYATTAAVNAALTAYLTLTAAANTYLKLAGGTLTGIVNAPNPAVTINTPQLATCQFVQAVNNQQIIKTGIFTGVTGDSSGGPIAFATPFPNACQGVSFTCLNGYVDIYLASFNATNFTWGSFLGDAECSVFYIAVGN